MSVDAIKSALLLKMTVIDTCFMINFLRILRNWKKNILHSEKAAGATFESEAWDSGTSMRL